MYNQFEKATTIFQPGFVLPLVEACGGAPHLEETKTLQGGSQAANPTDYGNAASVWESAINVP